MPTKTEHGQAISGNYIDDLLAASSRRLVEFLSADLDLGFTLVELARTERRLGVQDGADRCKRKARHVVETVLKLEKLLPSGQIKRSDSRASGGTRTHTVIFVSHIGSTNELETATRQSWQSILHAQRDESLALPTRTFGHCAPLGLGSTGCGPLGTR